MDQQETLAARFEEQRGRLRAVARRLLGSAAEADDAVQEAWLRLSRSDSGEVDNLNGWLTTVISRVCLDMLRARTARPVDALDDHAEEAVATETANGPEDEAVLGDAVGVALLLVLDTLGPAERLAFVLHDLFGVPFAEIAPVLERTPAAVRQLASRARRRVHGAAMPATEDRRRQQAVVEAFCKASRNGDFSALLTILDPQVVLRADEVAVANATAHQRHGAPTLDHVLHGSQAVAEAFSGRARGARPVWVDGVAGAAWAPHGAVRAVFRFSIVEDRVVGLEVIADPGHLAEVAVAFGESTGAAAQRLD